MLYFIYTFISFFLLFFSVFVFIESNPIYSVFFLITSFFFAAIILIFFNIDFLGVSFIIIYVGAIAILFLFVIMMLNVKHSPLFELFDYSSLITLFAVKILFYKLYLLLNRVLFNLDYSNPNIFYNYFWDDLSNIDVIGQSLYNYYNFLVVIVGFILLVAMIGAICLTLVFRKKNKAEQKSKQLSRSNNSFEMFL